METVKEYINKSVLLNMFGLINFKLLKLSTGYTGTKRELKALILKETGIKAQFTN
jgi:hypothetical protein